MDRRKILSTDCSLTVMFLAILLAALVSSVNTSKTVAQNRYGPSVKRPTFNTFNRPSNPFSGLLIPSPSHAYSVLARPHQQMGPPRFPPPQQQQLPPLPQPTQNQPIRFQAPPPQTQYNPAATYGTTYNQVASQQHANAVLQQPMFYPQLQQQQQQQPISSQPQQQPISFPTNQYQHTSAIYPPAQQQQQQSVSYYQPTQQQSVSYYHPTPQSNINQLSSNYITSSSSSNFLHYLPQNTQVLQSSASRPVHYHLTNNKQPLSTGTSNNVLTYEPCTNAHWSPLLSTGSVSAPSVSSSNNIFQATAISATRPLASPTGPAYFRYQPESSNKVVVLSHDVLKTLLANSKSNQQQSSKIETHDGVKGTVDNVATAASSASATIVTSNGNSLEKEQQPSVKLVGYIGPTSDNTPSGYIQVPVGKTVLENLSGSNLGSNYDFGVNASQYSLFTMKSVNDAQSLLGVINSANMDQETSASQNIPLGLVVSNNNDQSHQNDIKQADATNLFATSASTTSNDNSKPSIQMVGHVQVTSPDVSSQFTKREGKSGELVVVAEQEKNESKQ